MSQSIVVECRNQDVKNIQADLPNGQWTTNLQEKVVLEEGDTIICRNAFIDSRASNSQKIVIQEPLTLTLNFHRYLTNYYGAENILNNNDNSVNVNTTTSTIIPFDPVANTVVAQNDARNYVQCSVQTEPANTGSLPFIKFFGTNPFIGSGNFYIFLRYALTDGTIVNQQETLESIRNGDQMNLSPLTGGDVKFDFSRTDIPFNEGKPIRAFLKGTDGLTGDINLGYGPIDGVPLGNGFRSVVPHGGNNLGVTVLPPIDYFQEIQGKIYTPVEGQMTVIIDSGSYEPEELCEVFNRQCDQVTGNITNDDRAGDNQFLNLVGGGTPVALNNFIEIGGKDSTELYGYSINEREGFAQFVGANQVVLDYDDATQKFFFEFLHFPAYTSSNVEGVITIARPTDPGNYISYKEASLGVNQSIHVANRNGGIYFTKLSAEETATGTPRNEFFSETLGFDTALTLDDGTHNSDCILTRVAPTKKMPMEH